MNKSRLPGWLSFALLSFAAAPLQADSTSGGCVGDNGGLKLPPGFCATVYADHVGHARHLAIAADGTLYVNTWSGDYYTYGHADKLPQGGFLVALKDTRGTGHADVVKRFGESVRDGGAGGTGISIYKGGLYAEINDRIVRYALVPGSMLPKGKPTLIVSGLPSSGDHPMHPFVIDGNGNLFIDVGSATNACDLENRMPGTTGHDPCTELETRGGIWRFDANQTGQTFSPARRYATGIRNGEGMDFDSAGRLFVTQHGRDQLLENYPTLYSAQNGHDLPAEEVVALEPGGDYGWPACYYDGGQRKLVLAPEYGGDGGTRVGVCAGKRGPAFFFPAHWAPNDLVIYKGRNIQLPTGGVHSSRFMVLGIAHRPFKADITLYFSRSPTGTPQATTSCLRTGFPAPTRSRDGPWHARVDSLSGRMERSTCPRTCTARSGASPIRGRLMV